MCDKCPHNWVPIRYPCDLILSSFETEAGRIALAGWQGYLGVRAVLVSVCDSNICHAGMVSGKGACAGERERESRGQEVGKRWLQWRNSGG